MLCVYYFFVFSFNSKLWSFVVCLKLSVLVVFFILCFICLMIFWCFFFVIFVSLGVVFVLYFFLFLVVCVVWIILWIFLLIVCGVMLWILLKCFCCFCWCFVLLIVIFIECVILLVYMMMCFFVFWVVCLIVWISDCLEWRKFFLFVFRMVISDIFGILSFFFSRLMLINILCFLRWRLWMILICLSVLIFEWR